MLTINKLDNIRVGSLKERSFFIGIESTGRKDNFLNTLKRIRKKEDILSNNNFTHFAISGHT